MKKNKIDGVKPFNDFFFKSCYYHQLIAGLACFNMDRDNILMNSFLRIKGNFGFENKGFFEEEELAKLMGYKNIQCNINKRKLKKCIDKGQPVIVGVDYYYLESRADTYMSRHAPHFILAYGYNLLKNEVNVIDHNYTNSSQYIEKVISLDNLLIANKMFKTGIYKRRYTSYILKKTASVTKFNIWDYIKLEQVLSNRNNSLENLNGLKCLFTSNMEGLKENVKKITDYLQNLKSLYFTLSKTRFFMDDEKKEKIITRLISGYSNILSLFWKMKQQNNYEYAEKRQDIILRKIDEIKDLEIEMYDCFLEVCQ